MRKLAVYVHGKGGNATESEHYKPLLPEYDVIGFDYKSETPWDAKQEFTNLFDNYCKNDNGTNYCSCLFHKHTSSL